jgi:dGTPase
MSLEAKIMDWADDLTYAIHDVADFYEAGLIPLNELVRDTDEQDQFIKDFEETRGTTPGSWSATDFLDTFIPQLATVASQSETSSKYQKDHYLDTPFKGASGERAGLSFMTSELIERYIGRDDDVTVRIDPGIDGGLEIDAPLECEIDMLQYLSEHYVFNNSALVAQQHGHRQLVQELFKILLRATTEDSANSGILPTPFDEKIRRIHKNKLGYGNIDNDTLRARVVADIIASMTEQQAMELYERVTGHSPGLVTDRII